MVSPVLQPSWLFSGRNATYPAVQTFKASLSASGERFSISSAYAPASVPDPETLLLLAR
jgi:hypothetical protein